MSIIAIRILSAAAFVILAPLVGGLLDGVDRKITARMQGRVGPPILQPFYDVIKLMNKQLLDVERMQGLIILSFLFFMIFTGALFFAGVDMLLCMFALSTAEMFLILAATITHSPYSYIGSQRELMQMFCYEPMILLVPIGFYLATGSFKAIGTIMSATSPIIYTPGFFIAFIVVLTIKFRKSPFDFSTSHHAHQEVIKGITTEMVGIRYAFMTIAEWYETVFLLAIVGLYFVNQNWWSYLIGLAVILAVYFFEILIDNTSARVKWGTMLRISWASTLIFCGINLLILDVMR
jgi:Formate hydrogenlyase subunit 4